MFVCSKGKFRDENWQIIDSKETITGDFIVASKKIEQNKDELGIVELYVTPKFVKEELDLIIRELICTVAILDIALLIVLTVSMRFMLIRHIYHLLKIANSISEGDFQHAITIRKNDEIGGLANAFQHMQDRIAYVLNNLNELIQAVQMGKLEVRCNAETFLGDWQKICIGLNNRIDAFVNPIMMTSSSLDRLSKGDIPETILREYNGDFNKIKNHLNMLIDATEITTRVAEDIADGNLNVEVQERSEHDRMMNALNQMIKILKALLEETGAMIKAVGEGRLDIHGKAESFKGGWRELFPKSMLILCGL